MKLLFQYIVKFILHYLVMSNKIFSCGLFLSFYGYKGG